MTKDKLIPDVVKRFRTISTGNTTTSTTQMTTKTTTETTTTKTNDYDDDDYDLVPPGRKSKNN